MRKLELSKIILALVLFAGAGAYIYRADISDWVSWKIMESRLNHAISTVDQVWDGSLVDGGMIQRAISGPRGADTYGARKAFIDSYLCNPVFSTVHDAYDAADHQNSRCFDALYYAGSQDSAAQYAKKGIPPRAEAYVTRFKTVMLLRARKYFGDPKQLRAFYEAHKQEIVDAIHGLNPEQQQRILKDLANAQTAFATFYTPEVESAYSEVLRTEQEWMTSGYKDKQYEAMKAARQQLANVSANMEATMYAGRRHADGGPTLVAEYAAITADLRDTLKVTAQ